MFRSDRINRVDVVDANERRDTLSSQMSRFSVVVFFVQHQHQAGMLCELCDDRGQLVRADRGSQRLCGIGNAHAIEAARRM